MTTIDRADRLARIGGIITLVALAGLAGVYVRAISFTPVERLQGVAQKIFYLHVPTAWTALLAFAVTGLLSVLYLLLRDRRVDLVAAASAEVGVVFAVGMLTTGPIWGKPIWGTWWTWDARLTSTLFLFRLFVGYLVLRGVIIDPGTRARFSSVIGVMGLVLVPFIHITVYLFRTLHPRPVVLKPSAPSLPGTMLATLLISLSVFTLLYVGFVTQRYALAVMREARAEEAARDA
jgi:heme exporter protein C